jgi:GAF domain-containing protein
MSVPLKGQGEQVGLLSLGPRRNGLDYTPQDRQNLQEIVDVVAQAIEVAGRAR